MATDDTSLYLHCAQWVPIDAIEAYHDAVCGTAESSHRRCLRRLVSRDEMRHVFKRWRRLQYLDWSLILQTCVDAAHLDARTPNKAKTKADKELARIAGEAERLAERIERYKSACVDGKIHGPDSVGSLCAPTGQPWDHDGHRLIDGLKEIAQESRIHKHERYGVGKEAWINRTQDTKDGLPQFVRYFIPRMTTFYTPPTETPPAFSDTDISMLAIASLNIPATDDDYLGKIKSRVRELRREIQKRG